MLSEKGSFLNSKDIDVFIISINRERYREMRFFYLLEHLQAQEAGPCLIL